MGLFKNFENWINEVTTNKNIATNKNKEAERIQKLYSLDFKEKQYDYVPINNSENGYYVEVKSWEELTKEFGLNKFGNINVTPSYTKDMHKELHEALILMNKDCIKENNYPNSTNIKYSFKNYITIDGNDILMNLLKPASKLKLINNMCEYFNGLNCLKIYNNTEYATNIFSNAVNNINPYAYKTQEQVAELANAMNQGLKDHMKLLDARSQAYHNYLDLTKKYKIRNLKFEEEIIDKYLCEHDIEILKEMLNEVIKLDEKIQENSNLIYKKQQLYTKDKWIDDAILVYELLCKKAIINEEIDTNILFNFNDNIREQYTIFRKLSAKELLELIKD